MGSLLSFLGMFLPGPAQREPAPARFASPAEFLEFLISQGGEFPTDMLSRGEEEIAMTACRSGLVGFRAGAWADTDYFVAHAAR